MEQVKVSLCPSYGACPEVVIDGDPIGIGEHDNMVVRFDGKWRDHVLFGLLREESTGR